MSFTTAGVRLWDATEAASVHGASQAMGASINERIVSTFATTTARDAAFASLTSAQKAGIICWIVNRQGHSYWDPTSNKWEWVAVHRIIANQDQGGFTDIGGPGQAGVYKPIQSINTVTLPPGNRLIRVDYSAMATVITVLDASSPRISVSGTGMGGIGATNTWIQGIMPAGPPGWQLTLARSWQYVLSGTIDINVYGANGAGNSYHRWQNGRLDVTDLGPTDG